MGKSYIHAKVLFMQKTCGRPHACEQAPTRTPTPIFCLSSLTNRESFALEHSKSARKQTGCMIFRPDLSFYRMLLDVYFVTSKLGLLNVNDFILINFILLNANLKLLNINPHATEHKFQISEYINFSLNVKVIC